MTATELVAAWMHRTGKTTITMAEVRDLAQELRTIRELDLLLFGEVQV